MQISKQVQKFSENCQIQMKMFGKKLRIFCLRKNFENAIDIIWRTCRRARARSDALMTRSKTRNAAIADRLALAHASRRGQAGRSA